MIELEKNERLMTDITVEFVLPPTRAITSVRILVFVVEPYQTQYRLRFVGGPQGIAGHEDDVLDGPSIPMAAYQAGLMLSRNLENLQDEMRRRGYIVRNVKDGR